jgi:hypothetical protein
MKIAAPEPGISRLVARMVWRTEGFEPRTLRVTYSARHPVIEISSRRRSSPRLTPVKDRKMDTDVCPIANGS